MADAIAQLRKEGPGDAEFISSFATQSVSKPGQRRHILIELERVLREHASEDEVEPKSPSTLHVEHVYPQSPPEGTEWEDHDEWVNRIGNLTLLHKRWNTKIRNGDFATVKLPELKKSVILLNKAVVSQTSWTKKAITTRQESMAKLAPEAWPL